MISAGIGRYGPFVLHDGTYANLESVEDVFSIGLNRAVSVIAEKQAKGRGGRNGGTPAALKELGDHPDGGAITVRDGRYGPYVNWGKVNATLPKGKDPRSVTLDEALALIAEKAAKGGNGKKPLARQEEGLGTGLAQAHRRQEAPQRCASGPASRAEPGRSWSAADAATTSAALHRRESRPLGQARHRQGLRAEGRRPRLAEGHCCATCRTRACWRRAQAAVRPGALPHVVVLDIFARDPDGGLLARPAECAE